MPQIITIAVGTVFQDAGDATRALEIAQGIVAYQPQDVKVRIVFLSRGSRFEERAKDLGFEIFKADPPMSGVGLHQDLKMKPGELVGEFSIAYELLKGEIKAYTEIKPDVVLYGFWPFGSIARRMLEKEIPGICFLPLPIHENLFDVMPDAPEEMKLLSYLPHNIRKSIINHIPCRIRRCLPLLRHKNIDRAAQKLGWKRKPLMNIFDMLVSDITLVNDLYDFYEGGSFPGSFIFTGPVFSMPISSEVVDESIRKVFHNVGSTPRIFCSLGSSGTRDQLLEVVRIFTADTGLQWNAVILSPPSVCPIQDAREVLGERDGVVLTEAFVPARLVNAMADVVVCHGGQGTIQTAISSGTPLVGLATQSEQQINLDHIAAFGAGIRVPQRQWKSETIRQGISEVLSNKSYKAKALKLKDLLSKNNGKIKSALAIWNFLRQRGIYNVPINESMFQIMTSTDLKREMPVPKSE